jgi:hypothetical protein
VAAHWLAHQQGQLIEGKGLDRSLRGRTLAGPPSSTTEETSPSGLGVHRIPSILLRSHVLIVVGAHKTLIS